METPHSILKKFFGYDSFRPGQEQIVQRLLAGQDVLAVMPTGAGKSICYQVPALLLPGITLVVSPLVSLMKDQVGALVQAGVAAAFLNNSLTDNQKALMLHRAREGWYKIIYVAPERLEMPGFQRFVQEQPISMVTVDEAHCISQWGQDFRPSYLRIQAFVDSLPTRPVVGAFTATATAHVRDDIRTHLALRDPYEVTASFDRPNLYFATQRALPSEKPRRLLELVLQEGNHAGIVYCSTTKQVDETARLLQSRGIRAAAYHAKLDADTRRRNQDDFLYDRVQVMVATNAFGMESFSAIIVLMPILFPVATAYGIDPIHFGVIVCINLAIGYVTPPYGATLFVACGLTGKSVREVFPFVIPTILAMLVVLIIVTYLPQTYLWLPQLMG